jgi:hypothetical protein
MSKPDRYGWFDDWVGEYLEWAITLTPVRISSPKRFLELVGAEFLPSKEPCGVLALADEGTPDHVLVGVAPAPGKPDWVLGAESPAGVGYEKVSELSVPGVAVSFHCNEDSGAWFTWAVGGDVLVDFSLTDGGVISGSDPERLVDKMRDAGLDPDDTTHPCATAALLIEMITGVVITREVLETTKFTSGSVPFPWF